MKEWQEKRTVLHALLVSIAKELVRIVLLETVMLDTGVNIEQLVLHQLMGLLGRYVQYGGIVQPALLIQSTVM